MAQQWTSQLARVAITEMTMQRAKVFNVSLVLAAGIGFANLACAQEAHGPCAESVVLTDCPNQMVTPFQTQADRADAVQKQAMLARFSQAQAINRSNASVGDDNLESATVYGQAEQSNALTPVAQFNQDVEQSGAKDCKTGYATSGTGGSFGLSDLVVDTVTGHSCNWR